MEEIMEKIRAKIATKNHAYRKSITPDNVVKKASDVSNERITSILDEKSAQADALRYLESLHIENNEHILEKIEFNADDDLHLANLSVDIQTQTTLDTSKPRIIRPLVLKIRQILQNEIRSTLNPIVNNQIRFNSHTVKTLNSTVESLKENAQTVKTLNSTVESLKENAQTVKTLNSTVESLKKHVQTVQSITTNPDIRQSLQVNLTLIDAMKIQILELNISRLYNFHLHREPSAREISHWISLIKSGEKNASDVANLIMNSSEAQTIRKNQLKNIGIFIEDSNTAFKKINDHMLYFDPNDSFLLESFSKNEIYEKGTTATIKKLVKSGMTVINIGANIGYFTLLMARQVGTTGKVFAFEPFLPNVRLLQKNIDVNKYKNVQVISKAVSNNIQTTNLWLKESGTQHFISSKEMSEFNKVKIETVTIDDFLKDKNMKIDFILIDAEGSEKYILEGMAKTIQSNPDIEIITEYNPYTLETAGTSGQSYLDLIEKLGFLIYLIDDEKIEPVTIKRILKQFTYPNVANLYLTKKPVNLNKNEI